MHTVRQISSKDKWQQQAFSKGATWVPSYSIIINYLVAICRNLSHNAQMITEWFPRFDFTSFRFTPRLLGPREGLGVSVQHSVEY